MRERERLSHLDSMRIHLMTFRYSATLGGFDSEPLRDFLRDKEVIAFREHFFCVNEVPQLTCVVTYQNAVVPQAVIEGARENTAPDAREHAGGWRARGGRRDGRPDRRVRRADRSRCATPPRFRRGIRC